jgi:hypothetical protein
MQTSVLIFMGFLGVSAVFLALALSLPQTLLFDMVKIILLIIAMMFDLLAFSARFYSYLIVPTLRQRSKRIVLSNDSAYWLSASQDCLLRKHGDDYIATVYITIPVYRSATEQADDEKVDFARQVGRLVSLSRDPVRISTQLHVMSKDSYIIQLRNAISELEDEEAKLSQSNSDPKRLTYIRGKVAMWRNILDSITTSPSLELATYASLSALGTKEYEAVSIAQQKATELMAGIGAVFGVSPSIVMGQDLLKFIEPEYLVPYSTISEQIIRRVEEQVI